MNKKSLIITDIIFILVLELSLYCLYGLENVFYPSNFLFIITILLFARAKKVRKCKFLYDVITLLMGAFSIGFIIYAVVASEIIVYELFEILSFLFFPVVGFLKIYQDVKTSDSQIQKNTLWFDYFAIILMILSFVSYMILEKTYMSCWVEENFQLSLHLLFYVYSLIVLSRYLTFKNNH